MRWENNERVYRIETTTYSYLIDDGDEDNIANIILNNEKLNPIINESFVKGRKLNISFIFITQSYFVVLINIRLNSTYYSVMKIPNK